MQASHFKEELSRAVRAAFERAAAPVGDDAAVLEKPRDASHGDFCCPLALSMARPLKSNPRAIAEKVAAVLECPEWVADVQIAGAGFINITLKATAKIAVIAEILSTAPDYGRRPPCAESVLVEFVSANPTGPLHVGHGRACAYGDSLANILAFCGYDVRREYYVNNAGRQMHILVASVWLRYWLARRERSDNLPDGAYRGDYLIAVAADAKLTTALADSREPDEVLFSTMQQAETADAAADILVAACRAALPPTTSLGAAAAAVCDVILDTIIKEDMKALAVDTDGINFYYETTLHADGRVEKTMQQLRENGCLLEKDGALWFKASDYGDDKDRVVRRSNGELTYFAADIAYHADKLNRARPSANRYRLLNVLGADHHGYITRLQAAVRALGYADSLETQTIQFVALVENGERLKMSTRAGEFIGLRHVIDETSAAAARYFYVSRKNDQHLDFDLAVAKAHDLSNPVYYIQYANARIYSILGRWGGDEQTLSAATEATAALAEDAAAVRLCEKLMAYPEVLQRAAAERAPHTVALFLHELAAVLHGYYEATRILTASEDETGERLRLLLAVRAVLNGGMNLLGVTLPEKM